MPSKELDPRPPILALTICHLTRLHGSHRRTLQIHSCVHVHASTDANSVIMSVRMHPTAHQKNNNAFESSYRSNDCEQHLPIEPLLVLRFGIAVLLFKFGNLLFMPYTEKRTL